MKRFVLLLAILAGLGQVPAALLQTNLEYGRAGDTPLLLDVSVPDGPGPFPVAVIVHGGGWNSGTKGQDANLGRDISPLFAPLTRAHFTWFSIDYRLAPTNRWPAGFEDVQTAIRWIKAHAAEFKGDPHRVALIGHSAGGHLVCLAATLADDSTRVQAVVGLAAPNDLVADCARRGEVSKSLQNLLDLPQPTNEAAFKILHDISPINHVKPGLPPFLLMQGSADRTVPPVQAAAFQAVLRASNVPCDLVTITNAPHRIVDWDRFETNWGDEMTAWLQRTLAGPAETAKP
jgi:acetyl esterase/lipase